MIPRPAKVSAKGRPVRLSGRKLRRLFYQAGYRGEQIKVARERLREAAQRAAMHGGCTHQGVSRQELPELVGPRAARRIIRATTRIMLLVDEYWQLAPPDFAEIFRQARSLNAKWIPYAA